MPVETLASVTTDIPILLSVEADRAGVSVKSDQELRQWMAETVVPAFLKANLWTLAAVGALAAVDEANIVYNLITPGDRIINHQVIMALLGATTVQVGVITAIIARYLFPGRARDS